MVEEHNAELVIANQQLRREIEDRKRAEEALREERDKAQKYLDVAGVMFIVIGADEKVILINKKGCDVLEYKEEEITGKNWFDIFLPERIRDEIRSVFKKLMAGEIEPVEYYENPVLAKTGEEKIIAWHNTVLTDKTGNIIGTLSSGEDITERKRVEEALQESEERLRSLSSQLLTVQEKERKRIAQELHDTIGQSLTAIKYIVEHALEQMGKSSMSTPSITLEATIPVIQDAMEEVRRIGMDLRPSTLDDLGILATISWFCREFQAIYSGICIEKQIDIQENEVPDHLKTVVFRVLQEALNNVAKHSKADLVRLRLCKEAGGTIELVIQDNGLGFDVKDTLSVEISRKGFGLASMKDRTELSGGSFAIEPIRGAGTIVRASWPCN